VKIQTVHVYYAAATGVWQTDGRTDNNALTEWQRVSSSHLETWFRWLCRWIPRDTSYADNVVRGGGGVIRMTRRCSRACSALLMQTQRTGACSQIGSRRRNSVTRNLPSLSTAPPHNVWWSYRCNAGSLTSASSDGVQMQKHSTALKTRSKLNNTRDRFLSVSRRADSDGNPTDEMLTTKVMCLYSQSGGRMVFHNLNAGNWRV